MQGQSGGSGAAHMGQGQGLGQGSGYAQAGQPGMNTRVGEQGPGTGGAQVHSLNVHNLKILDLIYES